MTGTLFAVLALFFLGYLRRRLPTADADLLASLGIVDSHRQARRDS